MTLTGITWDHPRGYQPLYEASLLYKQLYGIEVIWEKRSLTKFGDQSLVSLASQFDLLIIDHPHVGMARAAGCLAPLDDLLPAVAQGQFAPQYAGPCYNSYYYKQQQWALPIDAAMQCASTRPDVMGAYPVPENWQQVFELTQALNKKGLQTGMALCPTDALCTFLSLTAQLGSPITEGNDLLVSKEVGLAALEMMRTMRDRFHKGSLGWNPIALYNHMATANDVAYAPLAFCYTNYSRPGFSNNLLHYHNAPGISNAVLGGAGIAVSASSKFAEAAANYALWVCSAAVQSGVYLQAQGQPAHSAVWQSSAANAATNNFFANTALSLQQAYVRPRYNGWPHFQQYLGEAVHGFLQQDGNTVKVLGQLQDAYAASKH